MTSASCVLVCLHACLDVVCCMHKLCKYVCVYAQGKILRNFSGCPQGNLNLTLGCPT